MVDPLVSVVIPSYNRPEWTQRAVDSVGAQTHSIEVVTERLTVVYEEVR